MNNIIVVEVVYSLEDLSYRDRGIAFGEATLFAYSVKELSSNGQLGDDVVFILPGSSALPFAVCSNTTNP